MTPSWRADTLPELAASLAAQPGHETVRTHLADILRHGLGVRASDLRQEDYRARVKGRIDTLFASTVFEWKSDLRREEGDVRRRLPDYLADVARCLGCFRRIVDRQGRAPTARQDHVRLGGAA